MTYPTFPILPITSYPIPRTLITNTIKEEALAGQTFRYPLRARPKWQWEIPFQGLREAFHGITGEWTTLQSFILSVLGAAYPFYFLDSLDNSATTQNFGTGDGVTTTFQLMRTLGTFVEPVYGAVGASIVSGALSGSPSIYINGSLQTLGTNYSIGPTGLITFVSAPSAAAALTWTGKFTFLCELDDDTATSELFAYGLYEMKKLSFSSKLL